MMTDTMERLGDALAAWIVPVNAWTAVLLACAVLVDRALARRARASLRIALYAPVALRALLPLSWSIPLAHAPRLTVLLPIQALSGSAPAAAHAGHWRLAMAFAYVGVAAGLALLAVTRRVLLARALASSRPVPGIEAPCPVLSHPELGPMVVGLLAPRVVLPQALLGAASEAALACISRHEAAHVRRRDPWLAAAMELSLVVAWPVVPMWIAAARVRHLMELACDEAALADAGPAERRRYGHLLLDVAEQRPLALGGAGSLHFGSTLRARIEAIALQRPWPRAVQVGLVAVAVAGFAACSSAGPSAVPQATADAKAAAAGGGLDEYGYQYEGEPVGSATAPDPAPATSAPERDAEGRLAPEVIQSVVRASFGWYRTCYENALKGNPTLQGRVTVSFAIDPTGHVQDAADHGSTLPEPVVQCVVRGFSWLSFPPPKDGYVTVIYPIEFAPGALRYGARTEVVSPDLER